jgi:hypothetical protein
MTALRRRKIAAALRKLFPRARKSSSLLAGPGCTCESCVQAWDRQHQSKGRSIHDPRLLRLGLF